MNKRLTSNDLLLIANKKNHEIKELNNYQSVKSCITLFCKSCSTSWTCTVAAWKAAKNGCPSCKRRAISCAHKGKAISEETRKLIGKKARCRPGSLTGFFGPAHPKWSGGYNRTPKSSSTLEYLWKQGIREKFAKKCAVTSAFYGQEKLVCHHLFSWSDNVELRYNWDNGVLLAEHVHNEFHRLYKFGNNTESQFAHFLVENYNFDWWLIKEKSNRWQPSAKLLEGMTKCREEGSETRK